MSPRALAALLVAGLIVAALLGAGLGWVLYEVGP